LYPFELLGNFAVYTHVEKTNTLGFGTQLLMCNANQFGWH